LIGLLQQVMLTHVTPVLKDWIICKRCHTDVRLQVLTAASMKFRVSWDVVPCSHVEVDDAVRTSETSVNFSVTTWCYIPEHSKLHAIQMFYFQVHRLLCLQMGHIP
jgi:hypothetical protein